MTKRIVFGLALSAAFLIWAATPAPALSKADQCRSLEALGRLALAKVAAGYQPKVWQLREKEKRQAWYYQNCQNVRAD